MTASGDIAMLSSRSSQSWRIEIDDWPALARSLHSNMMRVAGEHGGEWWGGGRFEFSDCDHAFQCVSTLREFGLSARVILRVSGSPSDV